MQLSDEHAAALLRELDRIIENDPYPLSPQIRALKEIRAVIKPYPVRERPPPSKALRAARARPIPETAANFSPPGSFSDHSIAVWAPTLDGVG